MDRQSELERIFSQLDFYEVITLINGLHLIELTKLYESYDQRRQDIYNTVKSALRSALK